MKELTLCLLLICSLLHTNAQVGGDRTTWKLNGVWWTNNNILNDPNELSFDILSAGITPQQIKSFYPQTKGVFATVTWSSLQPTQSQYSWTELDATLQSFADQGFYIILMIWTGSDCPDWIYQPPVNVPKVFTDDPNHNTFPYYFYTDDQGHQVYKNKWYSMLDAVAAHIDGYNSSLRNKIVIYQNAEGSTGDEGPYKGTVGNNQSQYKINRSDPEWIAFRQDAWIHLDGLYNPKTPQIHLLVNCDPDDPENVNDWLNTTIPKTA